MRSSNTFICMLPQEQQEKIRHLLLCYLHDSECIVGKQAEDIVNNAMDDRLCWIEDAIDITEFLMEDSDIDEERISEMVETATRDKGNTSGYSLNPLDDDDFDDEDYLFDIE